MREKSNEPYEQMAESGIKKNSEGFAFITTRMKKDPNIFSNFKILSSFKK